MEKNRIELPVSGMHCASCASNVERALARVEGIEDASVNYAMGRATFTVGDTPPPAQRVIDSVRAAGYGVETETARLRVEGMSCASCVNKVEKKLRESPGVISATVNLAAMTAEVVLIPGLANREAIPKVLGTIGYPAFWLSKSSSSPSVEHQHLEDSRSSFRRFLSAGIGAAIVMVLSMTDLIPESTSGWISFAITLLILATAGRGFFIGAWRLARHGSADMNTLIALGTGSAFLFSSVALFAPHLTPHQGDHSSLYFESAVMITALILLGRALESRAKAKASAAVSGLLKLTPPRATVIREGKDVEVETEKLVVADLIRVKPGERVPTDGKVVEGESAVDESLLTGEPIPVTKTEGDEVFGGTINGSGAFIFKATRVGSETTLASIARMVEQAQGSKAPIQRLADKVAAVFVPVVLVIAAIAFVVWMLIGPEPRLPFAITAFVSVLIIACPCAMGLATPTAVMVGTGNAAKRGALFKGGETLEQAGKINLLILDKTGTLTEGCPTVTGIDPVKGAEEDELLRLIASVEKSSEHPLGGAIVLEAQSRKLNIPKALNVKAFSGRGISGEVEGESVFIGSPGWIAELGKYEKELPISGEEGSTIIAAMQGKKFIGTIALSDSVRPGAKEAVAKLKSLGIEVVMATGDRAEAAKQVAKEVGIETFEAGLLPHQKVEIVERYKKKGSIVGMVGDGINDAPALAAADVGFAVGSGSDIALEASDVTLFGTDVGGIVRAVTIARQTLRIIKQNLFWAFIYNILGIPLAAGLLYPLTGHLLSPMIAAGAMAFSSVSVVGNSLRLRRAR